MKENSHAPLRAFSLARLTAAAACILLSATAAHALTQPNGTVIPVVDTGVGSCSDENIQMCLNQEEGGPLINALSAAAVTPETYKPICGLTFKVIARGAAFKSTFGWYNVNPNGKPPDFDLRSFLECTDGPGTVKVLNIVADPAYLGGEIGFFMATPENTNGNCPKITYGVGPVPGTVGHVYYSERKYNPDSVGPNSYIHLLTYNSVAHANSFYFGWEDKLSGGDNDFDDLLTRVEGIQCSGGGDPCVVSGKQGICANGSMQCQNGALACVQTNQPGTESCNAIDDDCNGSVDEGDLCALNEICYEGNCVPKCNSGEFKCTPPSVCNGDGVCVDAQCAAVSCDAGQVCAAGVCVGACDGVSCPFGHACSNGVCVETCAGITCDGDFVCVAGVCTPKCTCSGCSGAKTCDTASGKCEEAGCNPNPCGAGTHCVAGTCVDDCDGASCPKGESCTAGKCVPGGSGGAGAGGGGGVGLEGGIAMGGSGSSAGAGGESAARNVPRGGTQSADDAGCGCRTSRRGSSAALFAFSLLGLLLLGRRRVAGQPDSGASSSFFRGALACALCLSCFVDCSGEDATGSRSTSDGGPYDDDSQRLAHCEFEPAPVRSAGAAPTPGPVQAGFASGWLELPIGTPLGGYGARTSTFGGKGEEIRVDDRAARFATRFIPSTGTYDVPRIDAIALEAGEESLVILRTEAVFITEPVLFEVEKAITPDGSMRGRVLITASHTHSGWSNWLPSLNLVPGIDSPNKELFERAVAAHAKVAVAALAALEPARVGFAVDMNADPDDTISHDRREQNDTLLGPDGNTAGKGKDHAVWAMRVDRLDGSPLAAMLAFPIHGTRGEEENSLVTGDAPGAIQRALSQSLGYPVLHVQGAAGDVSPGGPSGRVACEEEKRCLDVPNLEIVGALAAQTFGAFVSGIQTRDTLALEVVTRTFYVGHAARVKRPDGRELYYPPPGDYTPDGIVFDDQGLLATPLDEFNAPSGAALCGEKFGAITAIPGTFGVAAYSSCNDVGKLAPTVAGLYELPLVPTPLCDTARATSSAVRFDTGDGDPMLLLTVPGEPTAPYVSYLRGRSPASPEHTLVLGYSQDHFGYALTAEDWLAGGYEPSINIWGPLEGEIVMDGILEGAELAWTPEREDPELGTSRAKTFPFPEFAHVEEIVTSDHGIVPGTLPATLFLPDTATIPASPQPDPQIPRATGAAHFVWLGGDPALDFPHVVIERETAPGTFQPLLDARGVTASSASGAVVVTYTPDPISDPAPAHHYYVATWQPVPPDAFSFEAPERPYALPLGNYRFRVTGLARTATEAVDYAVTSSAFEVVAAPLGTASATRSGSTISIVAELGAAPGLRALRSSGPSDHQLPLMGPWSVTVTSANGSKHASTVEPAADGTGSLTLSPAEVTAAVSVEVRDPAGNGGVIELLE